MSLSNPQVAVPSDVGNYLSRSGSSALCYRFQHRRTRVPREVESSGDLLLGRKLGECARTTADGNDCCDLGPAAVAAPRATEGLAAPHGHPVAPSYYQRVYTCGIDISIRETRPRGTFCAFDSGGSYATQNNRAGSRDRRSDEYSEWQPSDWPVETGRAK